MKNTGVAIAALLAISAVAEAQAPAVLTIDDAVALAMKDNREVQSAALDVERAMEGTDIVKTNRLPQFQTYVLGGEPFRAITATIPQGVLGSFAATGPIPAQDTTVTTPRQFTAFIFLQAAQPLSQLWKIHLQLTSSRISEDLAREKLRQQRQDTAQSVRDLYYQIAQTQTQIESAEAVEKDLVELQAETNRQLAQQSVLKEDVLAVRSRLSQQRYQLLNLRDASKTQKESLNRLLGRNLETEFSVESQPLPKPEEINLTAAQEMALSQRPEMHGARLQRKQAETEVRRQRAEYIPDISAALVYASFPNVSFAPQDAAGAGFVMQWQPFDWGQKRHKTKALRYAAQQKVLAERDTEQQILLDVNAKFRALTEARMRLDTAALVQEEQRERMRTVTNRYREKAVLLSGFLQQEAAVVQADSDYQSALSNFWRAKASFDRALGRE